jgi:hypothetical protein
MSRNVEIEPWEDCGVPNSNYPRREGAKSALTRALRMITEIRSKTIFMRTAKAYEAYCTT